MAKVAGCGQIHISGKHFVNSAREEFGLAKAFTMAMNE